MDTYIPADMQEYIDEHIGHSDYALYVLDGQTAELPGHGDDWHDAVAVEERGYQEQPRVTKFTRTPEGHILNYEIRS